MEPSVVEEIKIADGFGDVRQSVRWIIFKYKVTWKIRFDILIGEVGGLWRFPFQNRFMSSP